MAEMTPPTTPLYELVEQRMRAKDNDVMRISDVRLQRETKPDLERLQQVLREAGAHHEVVTAWVSGDTFNGLEIRWRRS